MLVAAFIGFDRMKELYEIAIKKKYRFLSYGDAMFLTRKWNTSFWKKMDTLEGVS